MIVLVSAVVVLAQAETQTYYGTALHHAHGFLAVRDRSCAIHQISLNGFDDSVDGKHVRVHSRVDANGVEQPITIEYSLGPGAPTNCVTESSIQTVIGVVKSWSHGNGFGVLQITPIGAQPISFSIPMTMIQVNGSRQSGEALDEFVHEGRTRVAVRYRTVMDISGPDTQVVGVDRVR